MNERIKELAELAKFEPLANGYHGYDDELERFAELVAADEREACARLCDDLAGQVGNKNFIAVDQRQFCAKQIRARSKHD